MNSLVTRRKIELKESFSNVTLHLSSVILLTKKSTYSLGKTDIINALLDQESELEMKRVNDNGRYLGILNNKDDKDESFRGMF